MVELEPAHLVVRSDPSISAIILKVPNESWEMVLAPSEAIDLVLLLISAIARVRGGEPREGAGAGVIVDAQGDPGINPDGDHAGGSPNPPPRLPVFFRPPPAGPAGPG
jgi:hypothetical protein